MGNFNYILKPGCHVYTCIALQYGFEELIFVWSQKAEEDGRNRVEALVKYKNLKALAKEENKTKLHMDNLERVRFTTRHCFICR